MNAELKELLSNPYTSAYLIRDGKAVKQAG